ncbi:unnamed protein product [Pleuronectes platessa]|uniref:PDZ domain-containing protein n=1 Tax=Pleuronectes platessa TaxID=8262 RepID=A0A9N7YB55_PLEPL|nr:unnamed protein product [Pleuronectes platessa]
MAVPPFPPPPPPPVLSPEGVFPAAPGVPAPSEGPCPPDSLALHPPPPSSSSSSSSETPVSLPHTHLCGGAEVVPGTGPSPPDQTHDEAERNQGTRGSVSAPQSLREANTLTKLPKSEAKSSDRPLVAGCSIETKESPVPELQAPRALLEQQSCRSFSSSSKQTAAAPLISPDLQTVNRDPSCCAVVPGQEMILEICKGRSGLGLSIVGGRDTQLDAIVIHEVYEEGAAARDGRLWAGDQILEVNGVDLRAASHEEAIAALRQTPADVCLTVLRDEAQDRDEDKLDMFQVELQKRSGRGLGLSIVGKRSGSGVFISEVVRGGVAQLDGRLMQGDQITSVNGDDTRHASQETVAAILKCARGPVLLELGRLKAASWISSRRISQGSQMSHVSGGSSGVVAPPLTQPPTSSDPPPPTLRP